MPVGVSPIDDTNRSASDSQYPWRGYNVTFDSDGCQVYLDHMRGYSNMSRDATAKAQYPLNVADLQWHIVPPEDMVGDVTMLNCSGIPTNRSQSDRADPVLWSLSNAHYTQTLINSTVPATSWSVNVLNVSAVMCIPSYTIQRVNLTYDSTQISTSHSQCQELK